MIRKLFDQTRPTYIRVRHSRLVVGDRETEALIASIRDVVPVRKLFDGAKLECWSVNGSRGKDNRICGFCPDSVRCQRRLRLHLLIGGDHEAELPAVLEVKAALFTALDEALDKAGPDTWRTTLFKIGVQPGSDGHDRLTFLPLF